MIRRVWKAILPFLFIFLGITVAKKLFSSRPEPPRQELAHVSPQVEAFEVQIEASTMEISAMGIVIPGQSLTLQPEIPGRIINMNPNMVPGGRVEKGDVLVQLDDREYKLAVKQQAAAVEQARVQLKIERSRGAIAKREWNIVRPRHKDSAGEELALRRPHLKSAQATLKAANSALERAKLTVGRTTIKAPFNALIQQENAEIGQLVGPGAPVAMMVGTDFMWIRVSVPTHSVRHIQLPNKEEKLEGARVKVYPSGSDRNDSQHREGYVVRLLGDLDPRGRMARVLVQVDNPMSSKAPLLLGSHVDVAITGPVFENTVKVPRSVIRDGDKIWLHTKERTLKIVKLDVAWSNAEFIYIKNELPKGSLIISSHLGAPVDGMSLRLIGPETAQRTP